MRIIAPYTERSDDNELCLAMLREADLEVYSILLPDDLAYGRLLASLWAEGETWLNIEHDIFGVTPEIVREFRRAPRNGAAPRIRTSTSPWVGPRGGDGCTKFGAQLMEQYVMEMLCPVLGSAYCCSFPSRLAGRAWQVKSATCWELPRRPRPSHSPDRRRGASTSASSVEIRLDVLLHVGVPPNADRCFGW